MELNITNAGFIISVIVAFFAVSGSVWAYQKKIKSMATMEDLKDTENRLKEADADIVHRVERIEDQLRKDISEIKESIKVIHNHILTCKK